MKVSGSNKKCQLKSDSKETYISPPCSPDFNFSSILSYSICGEHAVWITKEGQGFAIGNNSDGRIHDSLPKKIIENAQPIIINDKQGHQCKLISAVCGERYSLYLVSSKEKQTNQLVYVNSNINSAIPLFLDINGHNPQHLFGGRLQAAVVDSEGLIFMITEKGQIENIELPDNDRASCIACNEYLFFILGKSGRVFRYDFYEGKKSLDVVIELDGKDVIEVSGIWDHCLAVCKDGSVLTSGSNIVGQMGIGEESSSIDEFVKIQGLNAYKIVSASGGVGHSLFITSEGKVLACGSNFEGQLLFNDGPDHDFIYIPRETAITSGASFCIAGTDVSAVFIGQEVPPNTPNKVIKETKNPKETKDTKRSNDQSVQKLEEEIVRLKKEIERLKRGSVSSTLIDLLSSEVIDGLEKVEELGSGGGGRVYKVYKKEVYALKEMNVSHADHKDFQHFIGEYELMKMLKHPNILETYGIFMSDSKRPPCILLEYCRRNLDDEVKKKSLQAVQIVFIIYQIVEGMIYVHFRKVIHRDLKPSNIMITEDGTVKICDFGISKLMTAEEQTMTRGLGTQKFMAPEIINEEDYNEKADVYSFGVLLFFILSGGNMPKIKIRDICNGLKADIPNDFTEFARQLISDCWNFKDTDRPSFKEILERMEANKFQLVQLSNSQSKEVAKMISQHKAKIPTYDD